MRKSKALRLQQTSDLIAAYEEFGQANHYQMRFLRDMHHRLIREKYPSPRQRRWLDELIQQGPPVCRNPDRFAEIKSASETPGLSPNDKRVLTDFAGKVYAGYQLSVKQDAFLDSLLKKAKQIYVDGPWSPENDILLILEDCVKLACNRSHYYWETHPAEHKALISVKNYLSGADPYIEEWHVKKLIKSFRGKLKQLEEARHSEGDMVWTKHYDRNLKEEIVTFALIISGPSIGQDGHVVYTALAGSKVITQEKFYKRKPKTAKAL